MSVEGMLRDVRYALRILVRTPDFALTVVLTLALGLLPAQRAARVAPIEALRYE